MKLFVLRDYPYRRAIAPPYPPEQRSHLSTPQTAIAPFNSSNSDRTSSTSPKAIAQTAIASLNFPNSDRIPPTPQTAIAPLNSPNSDRTSSTPQTAIAPPQLPNPRSNPINFPKAIAPPQLPNISFLTNHRDTEDTEKERSHPLNSQTSFFNKPRRSEEHEGRREEENTLSNFIYSLRRCKFV
jgi:hypothetical protein